MTVDGLFATLEEIVGDSDDYFVIGSLSFLPLVPFYRDPGADLDVSLNREVYERQKDRISRVGSFRVLRLSEVTVARRFVVSRIVSPQTDFIHLRTENGLLDIQLYEEKEDFMETRLGLGSSLSLPRFILERVSTLTWNGIPYRAAPPEWMFAVKSVGYLRAHRERRLMST